MELGKLILQKLLLPFSTKDSIDGYLSAEDRERLQDYIRYWNFYNGDHWEEIVTDEDAPKTTINWCRKFVDKYVQTEFNAGFLFKFDPKVDEKNVEFLNKVWEDNNGNDLMANVGQSKSITGDGYIQVYFESPEEIDDPFGMYDGGRIRLFSIPSNIVFPKYRDGYNTGFDALESITIMFPVDVDSNILGKYNTKIMRYVYTREKVEVYENHDLIDTYPNKYGIIPIVPFRNLPLAGSFYGQSDLKDLIALNAEYNMKSSDVSQILDYNASPATIIQGAKPHNVEKGANKMWCVPKDAKVYNLELKGDLSASNNYIERVQSSIFNIGSMPKVAIGSDLSSNLSGVALEIAFKPLTDLIAQKRGQSEMSINYLNKIILKIGVEEGLISIPRGVKANTFYAHRVVWGDVIPRDRRVELDMILSELKAGLTSREDSMTRLYKDNVTNLLEKIEKDVKDHPQFYGIQPVSLPTSSRLVNSYNGNVIAKEIKEEVQKTSEENPQVDLKNTVGRDRDGQDNKVNTGIVDQTQSKEDNKEG